MESQNPALPLDMENQNPALPLESGAGSLKPGRHAR